MVTLGLKLTAPATLLAPKCKLVHNLNIKLQIQQKILKFYIQSSATLTPISTANVLQTYNIAEKLTCQNPVLLIVMHDFSCQSQPSDSRTIFFLTQTLTHPGFKNQTPDLLCALCSNLNKHKRLHKTDSAHAYIYLCQDTTRIFLFSRFSPEW